MSSLSAYPAFMSLPTLAQVRDYIAKAVDLPPRRRDEIISALNAVARAAGKPIGEIVASPDTLRGSLAAITPMRAGVSPARWANIRSLLRAALRHAGLDKMPGRQTEPLPPEWAELFRLLPSSQARFALSRFGRFCAGHGIRPDAVDDTVTATFLTVLEASLVRQPRQVHRTACRQWNIAASTIPGWPRTVLQVPDYRRDYAMRWDQLPPDLVTDAEAFFAHLAGTDPLAEIEFRPLRASSIATRRRQFIEIVSAMVINGVSLDTLTSIACVVRVDNVKAALRVILDRHRQAHPVAPGDAPRPSPHAHHLARFICTMARRWVQVEPAHLDALRAITRRLSPGPQGLSAQNRARLGQFDDPQAVHRFLTMPDRIMGKLGRVRTPSRKQALQAQTAVALGLLLVLPMRIANLAGLRLDRHLNRSARGVWHLSVPGHEVKNRQGLEAVIPADMGRIVDAYLKRFRPVLAPAGTDALFPGRTGGPKSTDMLREQLVKGIAAWTGLTVNPHLVRHVLAKLYLEAHPGAYGVVKLLLGHRSVTTTMSSYCGTETRAAFEHVDAFMSGLRRVAPHVGRENRP
jgi:integrase